MEDKVDRKHFEVVDLKDAGNDREYWLSLTPEERIFALEYMRKVCYGTNASKRGLQRFFEIVDRV